MIKKIQKQMAPYYILFFICIAYVLILYWGKTKNEFVNISDINQIINNDNNYFIDDIFLDKEVVVIRGWKIDNQDNTNIFNMKVVLEDLENQIYMEVPTMMERREDISHYLGSSRNYENSGFIGRILISNLEKKRYRVCILKEREQDIYLYPTKTIFSYDQGKLLIE